MGVAADLSAQAVVGPRCVLLEGSIVEKHSVLAAGSLLEAGRLIPGGQLWEGRPAQYVRDLSVDEIDEIQKVATGLNYAAQHQAAEYTPESFLYVQAEALRSKLEGAKANSKH